MTEMFRARSASRFRRVDGGGAAARPRGLALGALAAVVALAACDQGQQRRLVDTYRAAEFDVSRSRLARGALTLHTSFRLGNAYEVTSTRIEFVPVEPDADPPVDGGGELVGAQVRQAEMEEAVTPSAATAAATDAAGAPERRALKASVPGRLVRAKHLYYRWVVEYTSGGDRLSMRKSPIFRAAAEGNGAEATDAPI